MKPRCPACGSRDIESTSEFDLTLVEPDECRHDFECAECGCLFQIVYSPVSVVAVKVS